MPVQKQTETNVLASAQHGNQETKEYVADKHSVEAMDQVPLNDDDKEVAAVKQRLTEVMQRPENACCADCNAPSPKWASVNHGCLICTQCAGVHRSLGVHVSFVLSCTLDKWTAAQVRGVETVGNDALNEALEFAVPSDFQKPTPETPRTQRQRYIRAKYEEGLFKRNALNADKRQQVNITGESSSSNGADVNAAINNHGMVEYVGVLMIELIEAKDLAGMDINGKSDPYVILRLGEQSITSRHVSNSINPHWGQQLMLSWDGTSPLIAEIYDHNTLSADRSMGRIVINADELKRLHEAQTLDGWHQIMMPREWAKNFGEHMVAGAEGVGKGLYRGITGVWKDPIKGAKENGFEGFAKGMGIGVAGVVYRPIKGLGTMVKQTALSVGVGTKRGSIYDELVEAGSLHLSLSLQKF